MIPRVKVNYTIGQLLKAIFITDDQMHYKEHLIGLLRGYIGEQNILLTPSGRAGLYYILKSTDKPRVILPSYTCKAVVEASILAEKEVVYTEVQKGGFNMTTSALTSIVDSRCAVIATHQFGFPCDIESIVRLCHERNALIVEDVAPALGTKISGKLAGKFGDAAFYSFDSTKLINVPLKAGFVTVKDRSFFEKIVANYKNGIEAMPLSHKLKLIILSIALLILENPLLYKLFHWCYFDLKGRFTADTENLCLDYSEFYRYDMANWQAYIAILQIARIDQILSARRRLYAYYNKQLQSCRYFDLPPDDHGSEWGCSRFPIRVKKNRHSYYRKLVSRGVDCAFSFAYIACPAQFTIAHDIASSILDIPYYEKLSEIEMHRVVSIIRSIENEIHED